MQVVVVYGQYRHVHELQILNYGVLEVTATVLVHAADVTIQNRLAEAHTQAEARLLALDVHTEYVQQVYTDA